MFVCACLLMYLGAVFFEVYIYIWNYYTFSWLSVWRLLHFLQVVTGVSAFLLELDPTPASHLPFM